MRRPDAAWPYRVSDQIAPSLIINLAGSLVRDTPNLTFKALKTGGTFLRSIQRKLVASGNRLADSADTFLLAPELLAAACKGWF